MKTKTPTPNETDALFAHYACEDLEEIGLKPKTVKDIVMPSVQWRFKASFMDTYGDEIKALAENVQNIKVDFVTRRLDVVFRDTIDGAVMKALVRDFGHLHSSPMGAISVVVNPEAGDAASVLRYNVEELLAHTMEHDYASCEPLLHCMSFRFDKYGLV